jgi:histidinol-phosphate aminotransferase
MGGLIAAFGISGSAPFGFALQGRRRIQEFADGVRTDLQAEYDRMVKLSSNENPYGPSEAVMKAMTGAWKYANRYGYPDGGITEAIAAYHNATPDQVLLGSGSAEVLKAADDAFLPGHLKVVGVEPTFEVVYRFATNSRAEAVSVPLREDYTVDMKEIIRIARQNAADVGLVYICNPNNPTGNVVHKDDIKLLLDSIPGDIPVLIDEAYHHFVESPDYESSLKYALEGRKVIVTRTFSKIAALAGMRLGYGVGPREAIDQMRRVIYGSINAVVKYGGVAALKDTSYEAKIRRQNKKVREWTMAQLKTMGYETIPSETNFFMVNVRGDVTPVREQFRRKGILVGRKFPPMDTWLRVSVGTEEDMRLFVAAFKEILPA